MPRRIWIVLVPALVVLAGCGGDDEKQADEPSPTTQGVATATATTPGGTQTTPPANSPTLTVPPRTETGADEGRNGALRARALRNCRGQARAASDVPARVQQAAKRICDAVAGRSAARIDRAARAACVTVVVGATQSDAERAKRLEDCALID